MANSGSNGSAGRPWIRKCMFDPPRCVAPHMAGPEKSFHPVSDATRHADRRNTHPHSRKPPMAIGVDTSGRRSPGTQAAMLPATAQTCPEAGGAQKKHGEPQGPPCFISPMLAVSSRGAQTKTPRYFQPASLSHAARSCGWLFSHWVIDWV